MENHRQSTKERIWTYLNAFYQEKKTTPSLGAIMTALEIDHLKMRKGIAGLVNEGYVRVSMRGNKKFFTLIRSGGYK